MDPDLKNELLAILREMRGEERWAPEGFVELLGSKSNKPILLAVSAITAAIYDDDGDLVIYIAGDEIPFAVANTMDEVSQRIKDAKLAPLGRVLEALRK